MLDASIRIHFTNIQHLTSTSEESMNPSEIYRLLDRELESFRQAQTFKYEVPLESEQGGKVRVGSRDSDMRASNNYLGLANHPPLRQAAHKRIDRGRCTRA